MVSSRTVISLASRGFYPAGAWIMCANHTVSVDASSWEPGEPHTSPKSWMLLGGFENAGALEPWAPGSSGWDTLASVAKPEWLDSDGDAAEVQKRHTRVAVRAPTADVLTREAPRNAREREPEQLDRLGGFEFEKRPLLFKKCWEADLPVQSARKSRAERTQKSGAKVEQSARKGRPKSDPEREQKLLERCIKHIAEQAPAAPSRSDSEEARKVCRALHPSNTRETLDYDDLETYLMEFLLTGGDPRLPIHAEPRGRTARKSKKTESEETDYHNIRTHGSYTCRMCAKEQNGKELRTYVDGQLREAQKLVKGMGGKEVDSATTQQFLIELQRLFGRMPDLWFKVMGLLWFTLPPAQQHNEVEKVILGLETKAGAAPRDEDQVRPFLSLRFWT